MAMFVYHIYVYIYMTGIYIIQVLFVQEILCLSLIVKTIHVHKMSRYENIDQRSKCKIYLTWKILASLPTEKNHVAIILQLRHINNTVNVL